MKKMFIRGLGIVALALASGCSGGKSQVAGLEGDGVAGANTAVPTVPATAETAAAESAYRACLVHAARYADSGSAGPSELAALIAPLCYPQFSAFEAAADASFSDRDRAVFDRAGDERQIALASEAIRTERSQAALSSAGTPLPPP